MPGMLTSRSTRSGDCAVNSSSAFSPQSASTGSNFSARTAAARKWRIVSESSTIRILDMAARLYSLAWKERLMTPTFHADHIGSLLRPERLIVAARSVKDRTLDAAAFRAVQDECIRQAVALQESVGMTAVTDGEFRR